VRHLLCSVKEQVILVLNYKRKSSSVSRMTNSHNALLLPIRKLRNLALSFVMGLPYLIREAPICFLFILFVLPSDDKTVFL